VRVFFDTSVLVAALFEGHAFHRQAFPWLKRAREREFSFLVATRLLTFSVKDFQRLFAASFLVESSSGDRLCVP
jgi:predicted nucleic acid-binding protein